MRIPIVLAVAGLAAAPAAAQYPQYPYAPVPSPGNYLPNYYNRASQPLSPYLNLLRGGNPGVNYFYGVRPGTPAGGMGPMGTPGFNSLPAAQPLQFLPQAATVVDPGGDPIEPGGKQVTLSPAGHGAVFGNTFNGHGSYFSVYAQTGVRGLGQQAAGPRRGAAGLGMSQRPAGGGTPRR
jgi:hypothetical protein